MMLEDHWFTYKTTDKWRPGKCVKLIAEEWKTDQMDDGKAYVSQEF
jgi:hypothetical protein